VEEARFCEQIKAANSAGMQQNAHEFFADSFWADFDDGSRVFANGAERFGMNFEVEYRCEPNGAQESKAVFAEPFVGIADGSHEACVEVGSSVDVIDDGFREGIVEKAVDGEVAAERILLG
jgi:hypothetical protein